MESNVETSVYFDGQHYDIRYWNYTYDIAFWKRICESRKENILEFCAGTGRLTEIFSTNCNHVVAVDLSKSMLQVAQDKLAHIKNIEWVNENALTYKSERRFDAVYIGCCSIGDFSKADALSSIIKVAHSMLKEDGHFIFDGLTTQAMGEPIDEPQFRYKYNHPELGLVEVFNTRQIHGNLETVDLFYHWGSSVVKNHRVIRYYDVEEVVRTLEANQFKIDFLQSGYDEETYNDQSKNFVIGARRR